MILNHPTHAEKYNVELSHEDELHDHAALQCHNVTMKGLVS